MLGIIQHQNTQCKNYFNQKAASTRILHEANQSDLASQLLNLQIKANIESYYRTLSKMEVEVLKYLNYYFKKWDGNIQIPIKNLMDRFKCSSSWIEELVKRLKDKGLLITTKGGYGRKVTKRSFTERAKMVLTAVVKGFGAVSQVIPKKSTDYCTDYSGGHTKYISSKVDVYTTNNVIHNEEMDQEKKSLIFKMVREALRGKMNE